MSKREILLILARIPRLLYLLLKFRLKVSLRRRSFLHRFRKSIAGSDLDQGIAREIVAYEEELLRFSFLGTIRYFSGGTGLRTLKRVGKLKNPR
ncbi:MAG: hypothetical protein M1162_01415 [Candidatus Thermoplasmatota archaeon]|nr:hypothetical protein [Candidatus Thermoplasmatota archaeon]